MEIGPLKPTENYELCSNWVEKTENYEVFRGLRPKIAGNVHKSIHRKLRKVQGRKLRGHGYADFQQKNLHEGIWKNFSNFELKANCLIEI